MNASFSAAGVHPNGDLLLSSADSLCQQNEASHRPGDPVLSRQNTLFRTKNIETQVAWQAGDSILIHLGSSSYQTPFVANHCRAISHISWIMPAS